jgi:TonB family protein
MNRRRCLTLAVWCFALGTPLSAVPQDSIAAARDLYASAAYEEALNVLDRLPASPRTSEDARAIAEYRAFCLLALGRTTEAERAIETLVSEQPMFEPASADMSPRLRTMFADVRRRMLPIVIQQRYADAKAAYDRKEFAAASQGFQQVLTMLSEPSLAQLTGQPPLSDIRMLATGFHDLAVSAATPPPLPASPVAAPAPAPRAAEPAEPVRAAAPPSPPVNRVYASTDLDVVGPITIRQQLPPYPGQILAGKQGILEILIDETGAVESANMRVSINNAYDQLAVAAAKTWRYRPASVNGTPVKYRKAVQITIKASRP